MAAVEEEVVVVVEEGRLALDLRDAAGSGQVVADDTNPNVFAEDNDRCEVPPGDLPRSVLRVVENNLPWVPACTAVARTALQEELAEEGEDLVHYHTPDLKKKDVAVGYVGAVVHDAVDVAGCGMQLAQVLDFGPAHSVLVLVLDLHAVAYD